MHILTKRHTVYVTVKFVQDPAHHFHRFDFTCTKIPTPRTGVYRFMQIGHDAENDVAILEFWAYHTTAIVAREIEWAGVVLCDGEHRNKEGDENQERHGSWNMRHQNEKIDRIIMTPHCISPQTRPTHIGTVTTLYM